MSPARASIDPSDFTDLLPQILILGRHAPGQFLYRLAGGLVTDLHKRDMRRVDFVSTFAQADRPRMAAAMEASRRSAEPMVLIAEARTQDGLSARIEVLLAPLRADTLPPDRFLGLYQPLSPLAALRDRPVTELGVIRFASDDRAAFPPLRLVVNEGQRIA